MIKKRSRENPKNPSKSPEKMNVGDIKSISLMDEPIVSQCGVKNEHSILLGPLKDLTSTDNGINKDHEISAGTFE
jgi:hypothetical protein